MLFNKNFSKQFLQDIKAIILVFVSLYVYKVELSISLKSYLYVFDLQMFGPRALYSK